MTALDAFRRVVAGEIDGPPVGRLLDMRMTEIDEGRGVDGSSAGPDGCVGTAPTSVSAPLSTGAVGG